MFSVAQLSYTGAVAWSMSPAFLAYAKYRSCKESQDLREQKEHTHTGCPAPHLSSSLLSCS